MERLICINCNFLKFCYSQWYTKSSSSSTDLYLILIATSTNFKQIIFSESMLQKYVLKETNDFSFMPSSLSLSLKQNKPHGLNRKIQVTNSFYILDK